MEEKMFQSKEQEQLVYISPDPALVNDMNDRFCELLVDVCTATKKHVVIDFSHVKYLFSRAIGHLVRAYKIQQEKNKKIALVNASQETRDIIGAVGLENLLPMYDVFEEFLVALEKENENNEKNFEFSVEQYGKIIVVKTPTDFEPGTPVDTALKSLLPRLDAPVNIICLKNILFLEIATVQALHAASQSLGEGHTLVLTDVDPAVKTVLETTLPSGSLIYADSLEDTLARYK